MLLIWFAYCSREELFLKQEVEILNGFHYIYLNVIHDGIIDAGDIRMVDNHAYNSTSGYVNTDVNGDNFVDATDLMIVDNNIFNGIISIRP